MKVIERLFWEHDVILSMLDSLSCFIGKIDRGDSVLLADLTAATDFLTLYCDGIHHFREEDILFPALSRCASLSLESGPLAVMLSDHKYGHDRLAEMTGLQADCVSGARKPLELWAASARAYVKMISPHIQKENIVLYRMAEKYIDKKTADAIDELSRQHDVRTFERSQRLAGDAALFQLKHTI